MRNSQLDSIFAFTKQLEHVAKRHNVILPLPSSKTLERLNQATMNELTDLYERLIKTFQINLDMMGEYQDTPIEKIDLDFDILMLKKALNKFNLFVSDEEIFKLIKQGDIIEIYDFESRQIYRSFEFFKLCGYSIVELLLNDWNTLYTRPEAVSNKLFSYVDVIFKPDIRTLRYEIPTYLLTERYLDRNKAFLVEMLYMSQLIDKSSLKPAAYISTFRAEHADLGTKSSNISWI